MPTLVINLTLFLSQQLYYSLLLEQPTYYYIFIDLLIFRDDLFFA